MDRTVREFDLELEDGRTLHGYDRPPWGTPTRRAVYWHGGTPNLGAPPEPLFALSDRLGIRWLGHDRPGYGTSTPWAGRTVATAATDAATVADALGVEVFATMGHSGGGPHALACAALLPGRVTAAVTIAGPAPFSTSRFDPFADMADPGALRAAADGRVARELYERTAEERMPPFTPADWVALDGDWSWVLDVVRPALEGGPWAKIDDDVALAGDWDFMPQMITRPVLVLHGSVDAMIPVTHARALKRLIGTARLEIAEGESHVSVLTRAPSALEWLLI
jgi:pimeloyl-ACP methyl ester carboxylesterase